jgi:flagellum-specific peptidoglycan hydrolase FlgJ
MASATTIATFIERIAPCAQNSFQKLGKVKPSICIAMACVESAYGTAGSCKHNSFLGQKVGTGKTAKKYWDGTFFTSKTKEEYIIGVHTTIVGAFRSYRDMQQCTDNYYELLNTGLYSRVKADADYITQMKQIKACGYMTSSTEVNSVLTIIQKYNLTKYDFNSGVVTGNPYRLTSTLIKVGSKGESVKWLQYALNEKGASLVVDGKFGDATERAVRTYQDLKGLTVDGIAGKNTIAALKK